MSVRLSTANNSRTTKYLCVCVCVCVLLLSLILMLCKVRVKVTLARALRLCTGRTAHRRSRGIALIFHDNSTRKGVRGQCHAPAAFYPQERPGTNCTEGFVGARAGLDRCGKSRPPPGFDPRTV